MSSSGSARSKGTSWSPAAARFPHHSRSQGLLDTGAQWTAVPRALAKEIGLSISDWKTLSSSAFGGEEREAPVYEVRMTFGGFDAPDPPKWRTILVVGVTTIVSPGAIALIGRDLLATCRFTYDGRKRRLMMSY